MTTRWIFATLHLLALGIGLGAIWTRARNLARIPEAGAMQRALTADNWWGVAAGLWLLTGLVRFLALEKGTDYYLANPIFNAKMALFGIIFLLEAAPMRTLFKWRGALRRGETPDTSKAAVYARISLAQAGLIIGMVFAATAMARGMGG